MKTLTFKGRKNFNYKFKYNRRGTLKNNFFFFLAPLKKFKAYMLT